MKPFPTTFPSHRRYRINIIGTSRMAGWRREQFIDRLRAMYEFVASLPPHSIILHFDAYDVLFNAPPAVVAHHMVSSKMGVIFSGEKGPSLPKYSSHPPSYFFFCAFGGRVEQSHRKSMGVRV